MSSSCSSVYSYSRRTSRPGASKRTSGRRAALSTSTGSLALAFSPTRAGTARSCLSSFAPSHPAAHPLERSFDPHLPARLASARRSPSPSQLLLPHHPRVCGQDGRLLARRPAWRSALISRGPPTAGSGSDSARPLLGRRHLRDAPRGASSCPRCFSVSGLRSLTVAPVSSRPTVGRTSFSSGSSTPRARPSISRSISFSTRPNSGSCCPEDACGRRGPLP